jgi:hypothetical protein
MKENGWKGGYGHHEAHAVVKYCSLSGSQIGEEAVQHRRLLKQRNG